MPGFPGVGCTFYLGGPPLHFNLNIYTFYDTFCTMEKIRPAGNAAAGLFFYFPYQFIFLICIQGHRTPWQYFATDDFS
jgi:hypothetical protein